MRKVLSVAALFALMQISFPGGIVRFSGAITAGHIATWSSSGVLQDGGAVATGLASTKADVAGRTNNVAATTLVTVGASNATYSFFCGTILTTVAGTSSTLPACDVTFTDELGTPHTIAVTAQSSANTLSTLGTIAASNVYGITFQAKAATVIQFSTVGYASSPANVMAYSTHVALIGPY